MLLLFAKLCVIAFNSHHFFHLLNSLQNSVNYTYNIYNICIFEVKKFTRTFKYIFNIGCPHLLEHKLYEILL